MTTDSVENKLKVILKQYQDAFNGKNYSEENEDSDILMEVFGITANLKRENRQYWGRELGMCWQRLVTEVLSSFCADYGPAIRKGNDEPCDCVVGKDAIE